MMIDLLGQTFAGVRAFFEVFFFLLYALSERPKKKRAGSAAVSFVCFKQPALSVSKGICHGSTRLCSRA